MARILFDSLPGFTPLPFSAWSQTPIESILSREQSVDLPSVVVGDFNGDTKKDVAMKGNSGSTGASFILLSNADSLGKPRLIFIKPRRSSQETAESYLSLVHPQQFIDPTTLDTTVVLHTDAIQYIVRHTTWTLYYLEHGALREYTPVGD